MTRHGAADLFGPEARTVREFRTDHYGLRALLSLREQPIKFEIIREARIELQGALSPLGVPVLALADQVTETLLANADRCLDRSVADRDTIDLGYLLRGTQGRFPADAVAKAEAEAAYGEGVGRTVPGPGPSGGGGRAALRCGHTAHALGGRGRGVGVAACRDASRLAGGAVRGRPVGPTGVNGRPLAVPATPKALKEEARRVAA